MLMKVKLKNNSKQACMCIELCSDKHTTLTTQVWIEWPVSYKLMPETSRFFKVSSRYCFTRSRDLLTSAISSSICGTRISSICSRFPGTYAKTTSTSSLHELFPRIRITRIRTALNGRLNEGLPGCSRR